MKDYLKNSLIKVLIIFAIISLDLLTKQIFYSTSLYTIIPYIIGVRPLEYLNTGGAWSILSDKMWLLIAITIVFIAVVSIYDIKTKNNSIVYNLAFSFILGGAVGNLIDRIFLGGVRDFIYFIFAPNFPTFNLADSFLLVGCILFAIYAFFIYKPKEKGKNDTKK